MGTEKFRRGTMPRRRGANMTDSQPPDNRECMYVCIYGCMYVVKLKDR